MNDDEVGPRRRPKSVALAAVLAYLYAMALVTVAAGLVFELISGTGHVGAEHLHGQGLMGLLKVTALLLAGSLSLAVGAWRLVRWRQRRLILVPLTILLTVGVVGETADAVGSASTTSDLIGLGILILAAVPVALLTSSGARNWSSRR